MIEKINNIEDIINSIDMSDIAGVTESMSTEFSVALQNAVDVKMKGPKFDEFESMVRSSDFRENRIPMNDSLPK